MFTYPTTQIAPGPSATAPDAIFGGNLTTWFDAAVGVTTSGSNVTVWANQASGGNATASSSHPQYVASGSDGTPEVNFVGSNQGMSFTDPIGSSLTVWVFMNGTNKTLGNLFWSSGSNLGIFPQGFSVSGRPSIYNGGWFQIVQSMVGWHLIRFSIRDDGVGSCAITVDDTSENTVSLNWAPGAGVWTNLSRTGASQALTGPVKQVVVADLFVNDADSRHQQILDYFKATYPTLAQW